MYGAGRASTVADMSTSVVDDSVHEPMDGYRQRMARHRSGRRAALLQAVAIVTFSVMTFAGCSEPAGRQPDVSPAAWELPLRPGFTLDGYAAGLAGKGFDCLESERELRCHSSEGVEIAVVAAWPGREVAKVQAVLRGHGAASRAERVASAIAVGGAISIVAVHPRDQDALSKWVVGRWLDGEVITEDLFGGIRGSYSEDPSIGVTTVTVAAWR